MPHSTYPCHGTSLTPCHSPLSAANLSPSQQWPVSSLSSASLLYFWVVALSLLYPLSLAQTLSGHYPNFLLSITLILTQK